VDRDHGPHRRRSGRPRGSGWVFLPELPQAPERPRHRPSQQQNPGMRHSISAGMTENAQQRRYAERPESVADLGRSAHEQHRPDRCQSGKPIAIPGGYWRIRFHESRYRQPPLAGPARRRPRQHAGNPASAVPNRSHRGGEDRSRQGKPDLISLARNCHACRRIGRRERSPATGANQMHNMRRFWSSSAANRGDDGVFARRLAAHRTGRSRQAPEGCERGSPPHRDEAGCQPGNSRCERALMRRISG
jgi:hypothetical protein